MRRITVFQVGYDWTFAPGAGLECSWRTALEASNAAVQFGESLRGSAAGYVIRVAVADEDRRDVRTMTLHTRVFRSATGTLESTNRVEASHASAVH